MKTAFLCISVAAVFLAGLRPVEAAPVLFTDRSTFESNLDSSITDDYSDPGYVFNQSNAAMSAVLGETDYQTTGFTNWNLVTGGGYCAGCNGSFLLSFTSTSLGTSDGVYGAGMDILNNSPQLPYFAYLTFGTGAVLNQALPTGSSFFGVTADDLVQSIHFGLSGGGTTTSGSFRIDNLTIGAVDTQGGEIPEPGTWLLFGLGALGLAAVRRTRRRA